MYRCFSSLTLSHAIFTYIYISPYIHVYIYISLHLSLSIYICMYVCRERCIHTYQDAMTILLMGLHLVQEFQHQANISSGFTCWRVESNKLSL